ncbi:DUF6266 family protein [Daejeonella sp.]|uniref:DUF6266 family protein n=1 Tax=Daejeonella sp. TaxID=2805397 RepID=UPI00398337AD
MGRLNNGPNGGFSGKAGSFIGYNWKGGSYIRGLPRIKKNRQPTPGQLAARAKFAYLNMWLKKMPDIMAITFRSYSPKMTGMMASYSCNAGNVLGDYPDFQINFPAFMISHGELSGADNPTVSCDDDCTLTYNWEWLSGHQKASSKDACLLLAIIPETGSIYASFESTRYANTARLKIAKEQVGKVAEVYLSFVSFDRLKCSKSQYLGQVVLT